MLKVVDVQDFVCLRHKKNNDVVDEYIQLVNSQTPVINQVGAFAIKQIDAGSNFGQKLISKKVGTNVKLGNLNYTILKIYNEKDLLEETIKFFNDLGMPEEAKKYELKIKRIGQKSRSK